MDLELEQFFTQTGLVLEERPALVWRRVPVAQRRLSRLRGQDHQGDVMPEVTDGVHTWCKRLDGSWIIAVSNNVESISKVRHHGPVCNQARKPRTNKYDRMLSDFM